MYEAYWQLARKPFEPTSEQNDYYPSETHQGAMLKLRYAVENRRGAALLVGPGGTGKTMLVSTLGRSLPANFAPFVHLVFPQLSPAELVRYLADELAAPSNFAGLVSAAQSTGSAIKSEQCEVGLDFTIRRIQKFLAENTRQGKHAVIAVDEAQLLASSDTLETIRLLLNFESGGKPGLTLLLIGQGSLLPTLSRMPGLDERFGVKTLLRPLTQDETASYIMHRLRAAGATRTIFEPLALETIHALTHGIPRQINRLCDLALLIGFAEELPTLSATHVEAVCDELVAVGID
jgi:general secretion pathway protein A